MLAGVLAAPNLAVVDHLLAFLPAMSYRAYDVVRAPPRIILVRGEVSLICRIFLIRRVVKTVSW